MAQSVAQKLQLREGMTVSLLRSPADVRLDLPPSVRPVEAAAGADAVIAFVEHAADLDARIDPFLDAARRDVLAWICYPKARQRGTDLNRDRLWELLGDRGVRPVRQVSVDDVWSALRFRPA